MTADDVKLTILNSIVILMSFSNIENILKIILLIISIFYTLFKTIEFYNTKIKKQDGSNNNTKDTDFTSED